MALIGPGIRDMFEMERENPASYEGLLATHAKLMLEESFLHILCKAVIGMRLLHAAMMLTIHKMICWRNRWRGC